MWMRTFPFVPSALADARRAPAKIVLTLALVFGPALGLGCGTGATSTGSSSEIGTDGVSTQEPEPDVGPECLQDSDCTAILQDLLPCEIGVCDGGACAKQIIDDPEACDDDSPCTVDSCNADGTCDHEPVESDACCVFDADCDDGNPCTQGVCSSGGSCKYAAVEGSCDDGNPCTDEDACVFGGCQGTDNGSCRLACLLTGSAGDVVTCELGVARLGEGSPPAVALEMGLQWETASAALVELVDTICFEDTCTEKGIPSAATSLKPSGHNVVLDPSDPAAWDGAVDVQVLHVGSPDAPITGAFVGDGEAIEGDASFLGLRFELAADVEDEPVLMSALGATAAGGEALAAQVIDQLILTTDAPCGDFICWDGEPCTLDTCESETCSYALDTAPCDDGNPCTTGDVCGEGGLCAGAEIADEGSACTGEDKCTEVGACDALGSCVFDEGLNVACEESGTPCVSLVCEPTSGACNAQIHGGVTCDDASECTDFDACGSDGECSGKAITCDDGVGCTLDDCDPSTGCTTSPDDEPCEDDNPCTDDACLDTGCEHAPNVAGCDDGDPCTTTDTCDLGQCGGDIDPSCGCETTADCAPLDDTDLCNGTMACIEGTCQLDAETVVECPADGFQCMTDWTCAPASGECSGTAELDCDDGDGCTEDTCSVTKGCEHDLVPGCTDNWICELSGSSGELIACTIHLARGASLDPAPSGADFKLSWDPVLARVDNLEDEFCVGPSCFPFDLVQCDGSGESCSVQKLEPTGHDVVVVPDAAAIWEDWLSVLIFHAGIPGTPITDAIASGPGVDGDTQVVDIRFELLSDVSAAEPVKIYVSDYHFNPASGLDMDISFLEVGGETVFVASSP